MTRSAPVFLRERICENYLRFRPFRAAVAIAPLAGGFAFRRRREPRDPEFRRRSSAAYDRHGAAGLEI